jgi:hypothetical protein
MKSGRKEIWLHSSSIAVKLPGAPNLSGVYNFEETETAVQTYNKDVHLDDRLVTCAEYQLFIDEMRAHLKYHQPDHWNSHRFSGGDPDEPILGVRPSDAIAYCEWLAGREGGRWNFRLPSKQEGDNLLVVPSTQKPLGYWVTGTDHQAQFTWIGSPPQDAREINLFRAFTNAIERCYATVTDQERARSRAFDLFRIFELEQMLKRALDLDHDLALARKHAREYAGTLLLDHAPAIAVNADQTLDRDLNRALDLSRALDRASERSSALEHASNHALMQALEYGRNIDRSIVIDLVIYIDLLTLRERIAGRSSAFEGIRIVQERN